MSGLFTKKWKCKQMVWVTERWELSVIKLSLWLTYSTYSTNNNPGEKRKKRTKELICINYTTVAHLRLFREQRQLVAYTPNWYTWIAEEEIAIRLKSVISIFKWDVGRNSSVGIATRYGLDGPGIETWWGWNFPYPSRPTLGTTQPPIRWVPCLSRG